VLPTPALSDAMGRWQDPLGLALLAGGLGLITLAGVRATLPAGRPRALVPAVPVVLLLASGLYAWNDGGTWYADLTEQMDLLLPLTLLACALAVAARRPGVAATVAPGR